AMCCSALRRLSSSPMIATRSRRAAMRSTITSVIFRKARWWRRKLKLETGSGLAQACTDMAEGEPKNILMVDDDVALLRIVREALTSCLRCEVDTSPNPEYGFELALKKTYDLLIFDFSMPMIDGAMLFFLIGKVYENSKPPRVVPPLILVSGKADEERA